MKRTLYYLLFSLLSVHICHGCLNFTNHNVTFNATNFEYVLQWSKKDLVPDVSFNVQYKRYGQPEWVLLDECQNITSIFCNLTNAIFDDAEDFMENQYFGRVRALSTNCSSDWVMSKRLNPREDTYLMLPKLKYVQHVNSITILVLTPYVPMRSQPMTVEDLYWDDIFEYYLSFFNPEKHEIWQKTQMEKKFDISGLSPNTEYNGSVYILIGNKRKSDIQNFVVKTLPDRSLTTLIAILITIFTIALGALLIYLSYKYVKRQAQTPSSLDFKKMTRFQLITPSKENVISSCTVGASPLMFGQMHELSQKIRQEQSVNSQLITYASQLPASTTPLQPDSTLQPQSSYCPQKNNSMSNSCVHYGRVFEDKTNSNVKYLSNPTPNLCNMISYSSQADFQTNVHHPLLDYDSRTCKGLENNHGKFDLLFPFLSQETNTVLDITSSLSLISSVMVSDGFGFTGQMGQADEHSPALDLHFDDFTNDRLEKKDLEHSLLGKEGSPYSLKCPIENSQTDILDRTFVCEKPYSLQHPS